MCVGVPSLQLSRIKPDHDLQGCVMHGCATDEAVCDGSTAPTGEFGREGLLADEEWPTTQCFSRRAGEAFRGADYAAAVEVLTDSSARDAILAIIMVIGTLLGAAVTILWQV